ncbi:hypothetical protein P692DRAFT_20565602 [Suillus brevipes Sb2]|nr:hypothetical protein P692DRAFT_20565602 [Suillus brevipes Sb2]
MVTVISSTKGYIERSPFAPPPLSLTSDGVTNLPLQPLSSSSSLSNPPITSSTRSSTPQSHKSSATTSRYLTPQRNTCMRHPHRSAFTFLAPPRTQTEIVGVRKARWQ